MAVGIPLDVFPWGEAYRPGLRRDAAYLLRPDGHIVLASPAQDARELRAYAARHGLRLGTPA